MRCVLLNNSGPRGLSHDIAAACLTNLQEAAGDGAGRLASINPDDNGFYVFFVEGDELAGHFIRYVSGLAGTRTLAVHTATLQHQTLDFDLVLKDGELRNRVIRMLLAKYHELTA